jgi:hypothetical protein
MACLHQFIHFNLRRIGLAIKACYKVKCSEVNCCCGLVRRDIDEEVCVDLETREVNTPKSKRSSLSLDLIKYKHFTYK